MNEVVSKILDELNQFPLHLAFAGAEPNDRGEDILVFTCRELPGREFVYVPGKKGMTLGWDTARCPLPPAILEEFRRYYEEEAEKERQTWEEYLEDLLSELDASTSPLRTADLAPMLAERWAWSGPEEVEPPFDMPTEDEWEYLCSGGVHILFPWGDTLELEPIYNETFDKDAKNAFGLVIGNGCQAERVSDSPWRLKGDDGGCALCGGEGDRAAFPYSPYFQYGLPRYPGETDEELEKEMSKRWRRRVLRLTPPEI